MTSAGAAAAAAEAARDDEGRVRGVRSRSVIRARCNTCWGCLRVSWRSLTSWRWNRRVRGRSRARRAVSTPTRERTRRGKLGYRFAASDVRAALKNKIWFELCYGEALRDSTSRMWFFANAGVGEARGVETASFYRAASNARSTCVRCTTW